MFARFKNDQTFVSRIDILGTPTNKAVISGMETLILQELTNVVIKILLEKLLFPFFVTAK